MNSRNGSARILTKHCGGKESIGSRQRAQRVHKGHEVYPIGARTNCGRIDQAYGFANLVGFVVGIIFCSRVSLHALRGM